jgi:hypothetical protein
VALRLLPAVLCALVAGAHSMRSGWGALAVAGFALYPLIFLLRRPWVAVLTRLLLVAGALEWLRTAQDHARVRATLGQPASRLWLILVGVAVFHLVAAALLSGVRVREWFRRRPPARAAGLTARRSAGPACGPGGRAGSWDLPAPAPRRTRRRPRG